MSYRFVSGIYCSPTRMDPHSNNCELSISVQLLIGLFSDINVLTHPLRDSMDGLFRPSFTALQ
jgi:hypothetical protein